MNPDFWKARWSEGRIGFHEGKPNAFLQKFAGKLGEKRRVLVPLCGKTEDLAWLAGQGHQVVGVELVREAVEAFFDEHQLSPRISRHGALERFEAEGLELFVGDFFALTSKEAGSIDAVYDRAAIIALPPELRGKYVRQVRSLVQPGATGLVITLEYPQEERAGPPFSVPESELRKHYQGLDVTVLEEQPWESTGPEEARVTGRQVCYRIRF